MLKIASNCIYLWGVVGVHSVVITFFSVVSTPLQLASMNDEDASMAEAIAQSKTESAGPSTSTASQGPASFPEKSIQKIVSAGFSREDAVQALREFNGDVQNALISLAAKSLTF